MDTCLDTFSLVILNGKLSNKERDHMNYIGELANNIRWNLSLQCCIVLTCSAASFGTILKSSKSALFPTTMMLMSVIPSCAWISGEIFIKPFLLGAQS